MFPRALLIHQSDNSDQFNGRLNEILLECQAAFNRRTKMRVENDLFDA